MKHIHVDLGPDSYDIHVKNGLLDRAGDFVRSLTRSRAIAIISDSTVDGLYGDRLETSLQKASFVTHRLVFPAGEEHKMPNRSYTCMACCPMPALRAATTSSP